MKNLHKKIVVVSLASIVVLGGVGVSEINSFAASNSGVSERSIIGYSGFVGYNEKFKKEYEKLMEKIPDEEYKKYEKKYENMIEVIKKIVKGLPKKPYFKLHYVGLPFEEQDIESLKIKYNLKNLNSRSLSVAAIIKHMAYFKHLQNKNYLVKFNYKGENYHFIFYGESR